MASLYRPLASKNFGLSGSQISKHANVMLGREQMIANKFHDLNKMKWFSIRNVCGMINHATPANKDKQKY